METSFCPNKFHLLSELMSHKSMQDLQVATRNFIDNNFQIISATIKLLDCMFPQVLRAKKLSLLRSGACENPRVAVRRYLSGCSPSRATLKILLFIKCCFSRPLVCPTVNYFICLARPLHWDRARACCSRNVWDSKNKNTDIWIRRKRF